MSTVKGRKLVSFTGYVGFVKQLQTDEQLVVRHKNRKGEYVTTILSSEADFDRALYRELFPHEIGGFYAVAKTLTPLMTAKQVIPVSDYHEIDAEWTYAGRPAERLVFIALDLGIPAAEFAQGWNLQGCHLELSGYNGA